MKEFIREKEVSGFSTIAVQTLRNWRHLRKGPPYLKVGKRIVYDKDDVIAYLESKKVFPERGAEDVE